MPTPVLCGCAPCCDIDSDDFDRADSDSLGADWSERSGDADIVSNQLKFAATGVARFETAHPDGTSGNQYVTVDAVIAATTDHARVIVNYTDDNNYLYASIEQVSSCWVLRLREVNAGVDGGLQDDQAITFSPGTTVTFYVCWNSSTGILSAKIFQTPYTFGSTSTSGMVSIADGSKVGLAGSTNTTFDNFVFKKLKSATLTLCPDCETPCFIGSDVFDRSDSSSLGCDWEEVSGSWDIQTNKLRSISASASICKYKVFHPDAEEGHYVTVDIGGPPNNSIHRWRVLVNYLDANNHHWAELAWVSSGTQLDLTIGKTELGTPTTLATESVMGFAGPWPMTVCWDDENEILTASVQTAATTFGVNASSTRVDDGKYVALATGSGTAGSDTFNNFQFWKHASTEQPECPDCTEFSTGAECTCCTTPQPADSYTIDLGASALSDDCCNACDTIAGEYGVHLRNPTGHCDWIYSEYLCAGSCAFFSIILRIVSRSGECVWQVDVELNDDPGFGGSRCGCTAPHPNGFFARYESAEFDPTDCDAVPVTLTRIVYENNATDPLCSGTLPATITLEA